MAASINGVFETGMQNLIKNSKILLVGAGGIGCEVLKNLTMTGFGDLEIIDLDTIEVSNLNRQFLFNKESVGKAKSVVARDAVLKFNPDINIVAHVGDVMDNSYDGTFFRKFKLIINALDNKKARNHVNRMCLSCDIPLIESGTMGFNGQVEFIKKGLSQCYECSSKPEPKSYPMCTIRNTPKEPIHCIIWGKYLFGQLFGEAEEEVSMEQSLTASGSHSAKVSAREWAKIVNYDPERLCVKIFVDDIYYLLQMPDLFQNKIIKPRALDVLNVAIDVTTRTEYEHEPYNRVLSLPQYITMFFDSVVNIKEKLNKSTDGSLTWDKDDDDFMNFVVASSNIRSVNFHIPLMSHFDIKSMAGNIIPAVATANAIVAGQIVIHALRVLEGNYEHCQSVFLRELPNHKGGLLVKDKILQKPNPKCSTCSSEGEIVLFTDLFTLTLKQFEDIVLKQKLNMVQPDVIFNGSVLISSDEEDEMDMTKTLLEMGVQSGSRLTADDFHQSYSIKIIVHQKEVRETEEDSDEDDVVVYGNLNNLVEANNSASGENTNEDDGDDDDCLIECVSNEESLNGNDHVVQEEEEEGVNYEGMPFVINTVVGGQEACGNMIAQQGAYGESLSAALKAEISIEEANDMEQDEDYDEDLLSVMDTEISNEEKLANKRKAEDDDDEDEVEAKKSRSI